MLKAIKPRIEPGVARRLIKSNVERAATVVPLTVEDYGQVIRQMSELGVSGGAIYDGLIAHASRKASADRLLTFNTAHFNRVWPEGREIITSP